MSTRVRSIGLGLLLVALAAAAILAMDGPPATAPATFADKHVATVHVHDANGKLVGPVAVELVRKTPDQWREVLSRDEFSILREAGTERPFTGDLLSNEAHGVYTCAGCGLPLFSSASKFKSGTGWPSFFAPIAPGNVEERADRSLGMVRVEILCPRCQGHLGHVFKDGPRPTGLRYCVNSASLDFTPDEKLAELADPAATGSAAQATAVLAGGCFWCVEAVFEQFNGVLAVTSGYAGGSPQDADYRTVSSGRTRHAESVQIIYDPAVISYEDLLRIHLSTHDPTTLDRQGADVGHQYRSAIFYADDEQKAAAQAVIEEFTRKGVYDSPIVTTLEPLAGFYPAEDYHQDYVQHHPDDGYVKAVSLPKVAKARKLFPDRLKTVPPPTSD